MKSDEHTAPRDLATEICMIDCASECFPWWLSQLLLCDILGNCVMKAFLGICAESWIIPFRVKAKSTQKTTDVAINSETNY